MSDKNQERQTRLHEAEQWYSTEVAKSTSFPHSVSSNVHPFTPSFEEWVILLLLRNSPMYASEITRDYERLFGCTSPECVSILHTTFDELLTHEVIRTRTGTEKNPQYQTCDSWKSFILALGIPPCIERMA